MATIPMRSLKAQENYHYLAESLREIEFHLRGRIDDSGLIPREWQDISERRGSKPKEKMTLWVEKDVVKFFRGMGKGHTTWMADVLRTFMHARLANVIRGAAGVDYSRWEGAELTHRLHVITEYIKLRGENWEKPVVNRYDGAK
jgi:uncharacterized protein (DUF4415 family)